MRQARNLRQRYGRMLQCSAFLGVILLCSAAGSAQTAPAKQTPETTAEQELAKNPQLVAELGRFMDKLRHELKFPPARSESHLLPLAPESTMVYAALPNYGAVMQQALLLFRQELEESQVLRDWWHHGDIAATGAKVEDAVEKIYQLSQYVGDEMVISGTWEDKKAHVLAVAEVRKPGLKPLLAQMVSEMTGKSKPKVRVFDPQELAEAKEGKPEDELLVLVRPDYVIASLDLATLRGFNARRDQGTRGFASSPFGQRVAQAYQGGVTVLAAADVQKILSVVPKSSPQFQAAFQRSGFGDMKYWVWQHAKMEGKDVNEAELSFTGPRRGAAAWLAAPAPLGSLDFVSANAILAGSVILKDPAEIFEDVKGMITEANPNAFASQEQLEKTLNVSVKEDLLRQLGGEITVELDKLGPPAPVWRAILRVKDAERMQKTLTTLLTLVNMSPTAHESEEGTYYTIAVPSGKQTTTIHYAYVEGYLIVGPSHEAIEEAVRAHRSGESLGKSQKFLAEVPPGHTAAASAVLYEDTAAMTAAGLKQVSPDMAGALAQLAQEGTPSLMCVYGEESAIREVSTSASFDAGAALVVAGIAIPNVLRSRQAANEASAVGSLRTVNTAEVTYSTAYPQRGFATELAALGPGPAGTAASPSHAELIDETLGNASCKAGAWCGKSGYRFTLTSDCTKRPCTEYVAVATAESSDTGTRSFCSVEDGVIRYKAGEPLTVPVSAKECKAWPPLQ